MHLGVQAQPRQVCTQKSMAHLTLSQPRLSILKAHRSPAVHVFNSCCPCCFGQNAMSLQANPYFSTVQWKSIVIPLVLLLRSALMSKWNLIHKVTWISTKIRLTKNTKGPRVIWGSTGWPGSLRSLRRRWCQSSPNIFLGTARRSAIRRG